MKRRNHILATIGTILAGFITAQAQTTVTWNGSVSTDWNNTNNWSPKQVPTLLDHVIVTAGTVNMPANAVFNVMDWNGGDISAYSTSTAVKLSILAAPYIWMRH